MSDFNPYQAPSSELPDATLPADNPDAELAGRGTRLGASLIDSLISVLLILPVMFITGYWEKAMAVNTTVVDDLVLQLISAGLFIGVNAYLLAKSGQTVGKRLLNIQVVSRGTGRILTLGAITGRRILPVWLVSMVPAVGGLLTIVDVLFIFRDDRRCLHDMIADSVVVKVRKG